jgi:hypothetical protein
VGKSATPKGAHDGLAEPVIPMPMMTSFFPEYEDERHG